MPKSRRKISVELGINKLNKEPIVTKTMRLTKGDNTAYIVPGNKPVRAIIIKTIAPTVRCSSLIVMLFLDIVSKILY